MMPTEIGKDSGVDERDLTSPYDEDPDLRAIILQFVGTLDCEMPNLRGLFVQASSPRALSPAAAHAALVDFSRLAHRLKGSSKVLGFEAFGECFAALEDGARESEQGAHAHPHARGHAHPYAPLSDLGPLVDRCDRIHAGLRRRYLADRAGAGGAR